MVKSSKLFLFRTGMIFADFNSQVVATLVANRKSIKVATKVAPTIEPLVLTTKSSSLCRGNFLNLEVLHQ